MNQGVVYSMDRILFLDNSMKNDLYMPLSYWEPVLMFDFDSYRLKYRPVWGIQPHFEMGIVEGLKFVELVKGDGVPDRQSYFNSPENYPKDSGWIIPLMKGYHNARPL
jgi:hypothetical protein